jgi:two-component system chemotaxis response regulator CheB
LIRVVVVDDSEVCRSTLREILEQDRDIRVVGEAVDGSRALEVIRRERPHLVTMDLQMPVASGFDAIEEIMAAFPVPILVVTGQSKKSGAAAFEAIRRGALQLAEKPAPGRSSSAHELRAQVRLLSKVPVVWHVAGARSKPRIRKSIGPRAPSPPAPLPSVGSAPLIVGVAASAGGPGAIATVLAQIPATFSGCVAVVQHLPKGFAASFVEFLQSRTRLKVKLVSERAAREPGVVLVAPDDRHLVLNDRNELRAVELPRVDGFRPSATVLFRSLADMIGPGAVGVVLSGMGTDGAEGLERMRRRGSLTIAQDEATSAVYGMPRAAVEARAAELVLPLGQIAAALLQGGARRARSRYA